MAWMRAVSGRMKSDYSYSVSIVYNNFPWPNPNNMQIKAIEKLAQAVLDARVIYPDDSLADLYDPVAMPEKLQDAHAALDNAVLKLYGFARGISESSIVAELLAQYQILTK